MCFIQTPRHILPIKNGTACQPQASRQIPSHKDRRFNNSSCQLKARSRFNCKLQHSANCYGIAMDTNYCLTAVCAAASKAHWPLAQSSMKHSSKLRDYPCAGTTTRDVVLQSPHSTVTTTSTVHTLTRAVAHHFRMYEQTLQSPAQPLRHNQRQLNLPVIHHIDTPQTFAAPHRRH